VTLSDISIRRPVLATVMIGTLVVFGLAAYGDIGVDLFPNVEFPIVTVTAIYPGADPESVETKVLEKLEEAVGSVGGIDFMQGTAQENVATMVVQFQLGSARIRRRRTSATASRRSRASCPRTSRRPSSRSSTSAPRR
jgi:HAE1 family hydrophobic/amphiphilic exporter-1